MTETKSEARLLLAQASDPTLLDFLNKLSGKKIKRLLLSLEPDDFKKAAHLLLNPDPIPFAVSSEDVFKYIELMPRFMVSRIKKVEEKYFHFDSVYEFDEENKEYNAVEEHKTARGRTVMIPGSSSFYSIVGYKVVLWVNFKPRVVAHLAREYYGKRIKSDTYDLLLALEDGTLFISELLSLIRISPGGEIISIDTEDTVHRAFPLEGDKILTSSDGLKQCDVYTRDLELVRTIKAPDAHFQLSSTKFATWEEKKSLIWRYTDSPEGFTPLQTLPRININLYHDTLICEEGEMQSVWRFTGKEYEKLQEIKLGVYLDSLGSSLFSEEKGGLVENHRLWKVGHFGVKSFQEILHITTAHPLPSTKKSRSYLVNKLRDQMLKVPVEVVDVVVGFL